MSISFAVEEPGNKAEEVGKVFCVCVYMVVLTQIRIINIAKLFESFRMQLSCMHSPKQTSISGLGMRLVHVCHMTIYLLCTQGLLVVNSNDSNIFDTISTLNMRHSIILE